MGSGRALGRTKVFVAALLKQDFIVISICDQRIGKPAAIGRRSPDHHDNQQDEGKQHVPETVSEPHLSPVLPKKSCLATPTHPHPLILTVRHILDGYSKATNTHMMKPMVAVMAKMSV